MPGGRQLALEWGATPMAYDFSDTRYWFDRAEEMRTEARLMQDSSNREIMLRIADEFERLGRLAVERGPNSMRV